MEKNKDIRLLMIIIMASVTLIFIIMLIIPRFEKEDTKKYRLQSADGIIGIYLGDEMVAQYEEIVTDNLPFGDRAALERGIEFDSIEDAERALEDFDG